jgi:hypothetical protein
LSLPMVIVGILLIGWARKTPAVTT